MIQLRRLDDAHLGFLDQLRGVAIVFVIAVHTFYSAFPGGGAGVGVFFGLSGFLIGSKLLEERDFGLVQVLRFMLRRAMRIYPAYLTAVLLILFLSAISVPERAPLIVDALPGLLVFTRPLPWQPTGMSIAIIWSLKVEVAFYLFAPLAALVLGQRRGLIVLSIALLVSSGISAVILPNRVAALAYWGGTIALGVLTALAWKSKLLERPAIRVDVAIVASGIGLTLLLFIPQVSARIFFAEMMVGSLCACGLIIALLKAPSLPVWRSLKWIGRISYSLYLIHGIVIEYMRPLFGFSQVQKVVFFVPIVLSLSIVLYYLVEIPGIRFGRLVEAKMFGNR